jgi:hypothetical protein
MWRATTAHNAVIITFGQLVRLQFEGKDTNPDLPERRRLVNQEHRSFFVAIERSDSATARDSIYAHVMGQLGN